MTASEIEHLRSQLELLLIVQPSELAKLSKAAFDLRDSPIEYVSPEELLSMTPGKLRELGHTSLIVQDDAGPMAVLLSYETFLKFMGLKLAKVTV